MHILRMHSQCLKKRRYHDFDFAEKVLKRIAEQRGVVLRAYYCDLCAGFHLTSKGGAS